MSASINPPLPSSPPPPPPPPPASSSSTQQTAAVNTTTATTATMSPETMAAYHGYYQQYYQYMYSTMYAAAAAATATNSSAATVTTQPSYAAAYAGYSAAAYRQPTVPATAATASTAASSSTPAAFTSSTVTQRFNNQQPKKQQPESEKPKVAEATTDVQSNSKPVTSSESSAPSSTDASTIKAQQIKINLKFNKAGTLKTVSESTSSTVAATSQTEKTGQAQQQQAVAQIGVKKSRFSANSVSNVIQEQNRFKEQQQQQSATAVKAEPNAATTTAAQQVSELEICSEDKCDIVYDINKWPDALKNYCAKVYKHYAQISQVSEDQVTKYLQKKITDAFKVTPDLNTGWETEPVPEIYDIKQVAPFSMQQLKIQQRARQLAEQQKRQQQLLQQQKQEQLKKTSLLASIKENMSTTSASTTKKRKSRSSSSSSSSSSSTSSSSSSSKSNKKASSSTSSGSSDEDNGDSSAAKRRVNVGGNDDFIALTSSVRSRFMNGNYRNANGNQRAAHFNNEDVEQDVRLIPDFNKFSKTKQRKLIAKQNKRRAMARKAAAAVASSVGISNNLVVRKSFNSFNNDVSAPAQRKSFKNIFQLQQDETNDIELQEEAAHKMHILTGYSQDLEKEYLRLTGPPDPSMIRPVNVLKRSLSYVLSKYTKTKDYRYICDQLKAIRQDLTVQVIKNEFTIQVYETHARIAIKNKDRDEFNQCQNQLINLYSLMSSRSKSDAAYKDNLIEFTGYRLLYNMLTKSYKDLMLIEKEIKQKYASNDTLRHLLKLKNAWYLTNYITFFRLYKQADDMCKCLIDMFIERERKQALKIIIKSYRPTIGVDTLKDMLAYESLDACRTDLVAYKLTLIEDNQMLLLDCKSSNVQNL